MEVHAENSTFIAKQKDRLKMINDNFEKIRETIEQQKRLNINENKTELKRKDEIPLEIASMDYSNLILGCILVSTLVLNLVNALLIRGLNGVLNQLSKEIDISNACNK